MKKTIIISLLLLVVVCTVALCACQPVEEDFAWVKLLETTMQDTFYSGLVMMNFYPIEMVTDASYKAVVYGDAFRNAAGSGKPWHEKLLHIQCLYSAQPEQYGEWGSFSQCEVALYFFDEQQNVDGYAIVKVYNVNLKAQQGSFLESESETTHINYIFYYGEMVKSVKFRGGAIPFEQAQSIVESQLDLPQQSAN